MPTRTRREFVLALGAGVLAAPMAALTQQAAKSYRIGFLASETPSDPSQAKRLELLRSGLRDPGYVEGTNIVIDVRWTKDSTTGCPPWYRSSSL